MAVEIFALQNPWVTHLSRRRGCGLFDLQQAAEKRASDVSHWQAFKLGTVAAQHSMFHRLAKAGSRYSDLSRLRPWLDVAVKSVKASTALPTDNCKEEEEEN
jgi:hypothetical protein